MRRLKAFENTRCNDCNRLVEGETVFWFGSLKGVACWNCDPRATGPVQPAPRRAYNGARRSRPTRRRRTPAAVEAAIVPPDVLHTQTLAAAVVANAPDTVELSRLRALLAQVEASNRTLSDTLYNARTERNAATRQLTELRASNTIATHYSAAQAAVALVRSIGGLAPLARTRAASVAQRPLDMS